MSDAGWWWNVDGMLQSNGQGIQLMDRDPVTHGTFLGRWDSQGQVQWNKNFQHMNPQHWMRGQTITPSPTGSIVSGSFFPDHASYTTMYGAALDVNDEVQWARIYMLDSLEEDAGRILPTTDGGYLFQIQTPKGLSLSKLNNAGVPVWTKRYLPSLASNGYWMARAIAEPNGDITLYGGTTSPNSSFFLCRLNAEGVVQWKRSYTGNLLGLGPAMRAMNGDYLFLGGTLTRMNSQGDLLWQKVYTDLNESLPGSFTELGNGHILMISYQVGVMTEVAADGTLINAWARPDVALSDHQFLSGTAPHGDSLTIGATRQFDGWTTLMTASSTTSLGCYLEPYSFMSEGAALNPAEIVNDTMYVVRDSLKTWTMNIGYSQNSTDLDLACYVKSGLARPGFQHSAFGVITDEQLATSGPITASMTFSPLLSYVGAVPPPTSVVGQTVTWDLPAMGANTQRLVRVDLQTPPDPLLLGTSVDYTFSFTQDSTETSLANNTSTFSRIIGGAFDPNLKEVLPKDFYDIDTDSILDYTIQFQNTGTDTAFTVVVVDSLPMDVDVRTFQMGACSHTYSYTLTGNGILTVTFNNIQLPDSNTNELRSHGLINFRIKPILPLTIGQQITNAADIYFDFNPPVHTADATVIVVGSSGIAASPRVEKLVVYPVPVKDQLTATVPKEFAVQRAFIVGIDGRTMPTRFMHSQSDRISVNTQHLAAGAYVLTVVADDGCRLAARFTKD